MLKKGHNPKTVKETSNMRRVLSLVEQGMTDREDMAEILQIRRRQVDSALHNLCFMGQIEVCNHSYRKGNGYTVYVAKGCRPVDTKVFSGVSFIFWAG